MGTDARDAESQGAVSAAALGERVIRRRVRPCGHTNRAYGVRVSRKHPVDLDRYLADFSRPSVEEQSGKAGCVDGFRRGENEVVGCFDLNLLVALDAGRGGHQTIRIAGAEREIS